MDSETYKDNHYIWCRHEYDNHMWDISVYDGKNMDFADWLLQIEKVALLANSKEYKLATAKSTSNPYKMLKRLDGGRSWPDIKKRLEEVYSPIATELHVASDLHRKQWPDETLQEYIQKFTHLTEEAIGVDPANITNRVIIFLFIKNLYNKDIRRRVAGANIINTLADTFKLSHHSLIKQKKYEGLVYNEEQEIGDISQIVGISKNIGGIGNI